MKSFFLLAPALFFLSCAKAPLDEETRPQPDDPPHIQEARQILSKARVAIQGIRLDASVAETEWTKATDKSPAQAHYNTLQAILKEAEQAYRLTRQAFREVRKASEEKAIQDLLSQAKRGLSNLRSIQHTSQTTRLKLISALYQTRDESVGYEPNKAPAEVSPLD